MTRSDRAVPGATANGSAPSEESDRDPPIRRAFACRYQTHGYRSRYWMTYRQAQTLGGQVREGERSQFAIFYKSYTKSVESSARPGETLDEQRRVLRSYAVFSADQIDGLPADYHPAAVELVPPADELPDRARRFFDALPAQIIMAATAPITISSPMRSPCRWWHNSRREHCGRRRSRTKPGIGRRIPIA